MAEIRSWWRQRQHGLARRVHEFYDTVGRGIIYPFQVARDKLQGPVVSPMEVYRHDEWGAVLTVVEEVYERLTWLSDSSDRLLKPFLDQMLAGRSRSQLLEELRTEHERVDFDRELSQAVDSEMRAFETGSPELYRFVRQLKNVSAAVRPLTSVVLFSIGWGPAAHVLSPMVAPLVDMGTHSVAPIIADFASGAAAAVAGDTAMASGANFLEARFRRLQTAFTKRRVDWLLAQLEGAAVRHGAARPASGRRPFRGPTRSRSSRPESPGSNSNWRLQKSRSIMKANRPNAKVARQGAGTRIRLWTLDFGLWTF